MTEIQELKYEINRLTEKMEKLEKIIELMGGCPHTFVHVETSWSSYDICKICSLEKNAVLKPTHPLNQKNALESSPN